MLEMHSRRKSEGSGRKNSRLELRRPMSTIITVGQPGVSY